MLSARQFPAKRWLFPGWWGLLLVIGRGHAQQLAMPPADNQQLSRSTAWRLRPRLSTRKAVIKAHTLYKIDAQNYETCFFLAAAYGFEARLHAERRDWRQATVSSRRALNYLQKSRPANGLRSEPELGFGLRPPTTSTCASCKPRCASGLQKASCWKVFLKTSLKKPKGSDSGAAR